MVDWLKDNWQWLIGIYLLWKCSATLEVLMPLIGEMRATQHEMRRTIESMEDNVSSIERRLNPRGPPDYFADKAREERAAMGAPPIP